MTNRIDVDAELDVWAVALFEALGFTKEQLAEFTEKVDPDLAVKINEAMERGDSKEVIRAMAEADATMGEREMRLVAQKWLH